MSELRKQFLEALDVQDKELYDSLEDVFVEPLNMTIFARPPKLSDEEYYDSSNYPNTVDRYLEMFIRLALDSRGKKLFDKKDKKRFRASRIFLEFLTDVLIDMKAIDPEDETEQEYINKAKEELEQAQEEDQ